MEKFDSFPATNNIQVIELCGDTGQAGDALLYFPGEPHHGQFPLQLSQCPGVSGQQRRELRLTEDTVEVRGAAGGGGVGQDISVTSKLQSGNNYRDYDNNISDQCI